MMMLTNVNIMSILHEGFEWREAEEAVFFLCMYVCVCVMSVVRR